MSLALALTIHNKHTSFVCQSFPSDYSAEHLVHTDVRYHFIPTTSQFLHPRSFWPSVIRSIQPFCPCRAEEAVLGASFNAQSQAPDIPGVSLHGASSPYAASLQAQSLVSAIQLVLLREYMEELSVSFNAQDQAPDDSYAQDRRCAPCIFFDIPRKGSQVLARLLTK